MKKSIIAVAATVALGSALLATPAFAADNTMTATYDVAESYQVSIPASITVGSGNATVSTTQCILASGHTLKVDLTGSANNFALKNGTSEYSAYQLLKGSDALAVNDNVLSVAAGAANGSQALTASLTGSAAVDSILAGTYTDTLTFTVSVS